MEPMSESRLRELEGMYAKATKGEWTVDCRDWLGRPAQDLYISGDHYRDPDGPCSTGIAIVTCPITGSVVGKANAETIIEIHNAFPALAAAARKGLQQRWIPVSERLPEKDLLVNVMQIDGAIGAGLIMESGSWWCIVPKTDTKDAPITHWQPLPEPPQALTDGGTGG